jgi:hypothetical protein
VITVADPDCGDTVRDTPGVAWPTSTVSCWLLPEYVPGSEKSVSMVCWPAARPETGPKVATPSPFTGTGEPSPVPSTAHCTVPPATGLEPEVTVAVKVTGWPTTGAAGAAVTDTDEGARLTWYPVTLAAPEA